MLACRAYNAVLRGRLSSNVRHQNPFCAQPTSEMRTSNFLQLLALLVMGPTCAQAQTFRCTVQGKTVYQQTPCAGGTTVNTSGAGRADPTSPQATEARAMVQSLQRRDLVDQAVRSGQLLIGMTSEEVLRSWGQPTVVNRTVTANSVSEQWVYRAEKSVNANYAYIENGFLRSVQLSEPAQKPKTPSMAVLR
jgi:hypothetical protein